ncbi:putative toxin-antitoxin system toxin component, PIN family [Niveibacterium terrae]|uniref:putative toxin-antitoxin system toxin component, PIN family n=1 Tax=Niveibacterium terrae TaxID=3373598 RepID=UPI003A901F83
MLNEVTEYPDLSRVVLDTNTVMALWHFRDPALSRLRAALEAGEIRPFLRPDCREELRRVLAYPQFRIEAGKQASLLADYEALCTMLVQREPDPELPRCRDGDDQKFLELAIQAEVPALISRDKALLRLARHRLLRERLRILTPERVEVELAEAASGQ